MDSAGTKALQNAQKRLEAGDAPGALDALLQAWRGYPHPRIAALIERLSEAIDDCLIPLPGARQSDGVVRWIDVDGAGRAADVPRLLAVLFDVPPRAVGRRLQCLGRRPPDPRISSALVKFIPTRRWTSKSTRPIWTALFAVLESMADPTVAPLLRSELAALQPAAVAANRTFEPYLYRRIETCLERLPAPSRAKDPRGLRPLVTAIKRWSSRTAASDEEELFAHVAARRAVDGSPAARSQPRRPTMAATPRLPHANHLAWKAQHEQATAGATAPLVGLWRASSCTGRDCDDQSRSTRSVGAAFGGQRFVASL